MKVRYLTFLMCIAFVISTLGACDMTETRPSEAVMPCSSEEYESGDWTVDSLVEHFKSIGFRNIKTNVKNTIYREKEGIEKVEIEIYPSDSWFTEYRRIAKGDTYETHREIYIEATIFVSTITIDNNEEFANVVSANKDNAYDALKQFLNNHEGEYIEFDATIIKNTKPTESSKGLYLWLAIENGNAIIYKNGVKDKELGIRQGVSDSLGETNHIIGYIEDGEINILLRTPINDE